MLCTPREGESDWGCKEERAPSTHRPRCAFLAKGVRLTFPMDKRDARFPR